MKFNICLADLDYPEQAHAVLALTNAYSQDPMGSGEALPETVQFKLIEQLRQHPGTLSFLVWEGEQAVAIANCVLSFSTFKAGSVLNLHDLFVLPEYRGQGLGRALLQHIEQYAREAECAKLTLEVRSDNSAQQLYQKCGFAPDVSEACQMWFWQKLM